MPRKNCSSKMPKITLTTVLVNCILLFGLFGQSDLHFQHLTNNEGLPSNRINCLFQDSCGFIWIGTDNGVCRYDGQEVLSFYPDSNANSHLVGNAILEFCPKINSDDFWVATNSGLLSFDQDKYSFSEVKVFNNRPKGLSEAIMSMSYDKKGNLWLATFHGIYVYNPEWQLQAHFMAADSTHSLSKNLVTAIACNHNGDMLVGTTKGLQVYDGVNFKRLYIKANMAHIVKIYNDSKGNVWIGTNRRGLFMIKKGDYKNNLLRFNKGNGLLINNRPIDIVEDVDGSFFIADRDGGLVHLNKNLKEVKFYFPDVYKKNSINGSALVALLKDSHHNIWVGSFTSGLNLIDRSRKPIKHYKVNYNPTGLFNNNIRCAFEDSEGTIWIGTKEFGGLSRFNREDGTFKHYVPEKNKPNSLSDANVFSICELNKDILAIGTFRKGLSFFNKRTEKFTHYKPKGESPKTVTNGSIYGLYKDTHGKLWVGTRKGLEVYDPKTKLFTKIPQISGVQCILQENDSLIWLGSYVHGLYLLNMNTKESMRYYVDHKDPRSIGSNVITSLQKDSKGNLWIATNDAGFYILKKGAKHVKRIGANFGLRENTITNLLVDNKDNLWLTTNKGLAKYNPQARELKRFDVLDGLQGVIFEPLSCLKTSKGELLFGGRNGFNIFDPEDITENQNIPNVVISKFMINNREINPHTENSPLTKHIIHTHEIKLKYTRSKIGFEFITLNYSTPEKNHYKYKLEGFEDEWVKSGKKKEATYTNIPPGSYTLRVVASNNDGVWNTNGAILKITIQPLWWQTLVFKISVGLLFIVFCIVVYYLRMYSLTKQKNILQNKVEQRTKEIAEKNIILEQQTTELIQVNAKLKEQQQQVFEQAEELRMQAGTLNVSNQELRELNTTKDKFFSIIAHDLKNPFSAILGYTNLLLMRLDAYDKEKIRYSIRKIDSSAQNLYKLLENLLQWSRSQLDLMKIIPEDIALYDMITEIKMLLHDDLERKNLSLEIVVPEDLTICTDKNVMDTVLRNLIVNAIKFSENGVIKVYTKEREGAVYIYVKDYGVGMSEEVMQGLFKLKRSRTIQGTHGETGTGLGLIICKEFITRCMGEIGVNSKEGEFTEFYFSLPMAMVNA